MKRVFLVQHLIRAGCELEGEEPAHSNWINPANEKRAQVPRQQEIDIPDAQRIYNELDIENPNETITPLH